MIPKTLIVGPVARITGLLATCAVLAATAACSGSDPGPLRPGVSAEADVRAWYGRPEIVWSFEDGSRELQYPMRTGGATVRVRIGPDGRVDTIEDALQRSRLARVAPGWTRDDVRHWLGRPVSRVDYALSGRSLWRWPALDPHGAPIVYEVLFDAGGRVERIDLGPVIAEGA